jgi:hypothetical protein
MMGTPVVWSRANDSVVFMWPYLDKLTSFRYEPAGRKLSLLQTSGPYGVTGGMLSLSTKGTDESSAVLWVNMSTGGGGGVGSTSAIRAYDPTTLTMLWESPLAGYAKWVPPTVSGGRVYVPGWTSAGGTDVVAFGTRACGD